MTGVNPPSGLKVEIVEVAPRDGFQSIKKPIPTDAKIHIIEGLIAAGCLHIEAGSFVSPRAVPQMADMSEVARHLRNEKGVRLSVLVPNLKGVELALDNGFADIVFVLSASESHNHNNVGRNVEESLHEFSRVAGRLQSHGLHRLRINVATAFDCPFEGATPLDTVRKVLMRVWKITPNVEVALCDTTGRANPAQVKQYFATCIQECPHPDTRWAFHGHDTFGMGVVNAFFAYQAGVRVFDVSAAGLGGCPFASGATGNTATEDLVFALEEAGISTGVDMRRLLEVADTISGLPGSAVNSHLRHVPRARALPVTPTGEV